MDHVSPEHLSYLVGIGSNLPTALGNPEATVNWAINALGTKPYHTVTPSRLFRSPAFPYGDNPDFVNAAAVVRSPMQPDCFLQFAHDLEAKCNRVRRRRWEPRTLDIDVIGCLDVIFPDRTTLDYWMDMSTEAQAVSVPDGLVLPHPRMHQRGFVLLPLLDVAANWVHPTLGKTVAAMVAELPPDALTGVEPL